MKAKVSHEQSCGPLVGHRHGAFTLRHIRANTVSEKNNGGGLRDVLCHKEEKM